MKPCGRRRSEFREDTEGNTLRVDFGESVVFRRIHEKWAVTGGKNFEVAGVRRTGDSNKSDEATWVEVTSNRIINGSESAEQRDIGAKIRARIGATNTGEHGGPDAMAGDIA